MKIKTIKKTLDVPKDLHQEIISIVEANYGMTFTQAAVEAFKLWVANPKVDLKLPQKKNEARARNG